MTGSGMGVLNEVISYARFGKACLIPGFDEKATFILEVIDIDDEETFEGSSGDVNLHL
jgi:hypothetical protein